MHFHIRPFIKSDVEPFRCLRNEVITSTLFIYENETWKPEMAVKWHEDLVNESRPALTAEVNGKFVGCCYANFFRTVSASRGLAEISIFIDRSQRKRGIAKALIIAMEKCLSKEGYFGMTAVIDTENMPANALFSELAFNEIGILERAAHLRDSWRSARILHKQIAPYS